MFNTVMIVPTGLGARIGGHAGDANPAAKLLASVSDRLITHPNVVNASDINEMTDNTLYVEGSILFDFLVGKTNLKEIKSNKILLVVNAPVLNEIVNAVSAARATIGCEVEIVELNTPLRMIAGKNSDGSAGGKVLGYKELLDQIKIYDFDALAINTPIECDHNVALEYLNGSGGINPWGGVEAIASKLIARKLKKPTAHSPTENPLMKNYNEIVDVRIAAEVVSTAYLHCVLKGLWRAPRPVGKDKGLTYLDVDVMVSPDKCWGASHEACVVNNIPIIMVKENFITAGQKHIPEPVVYAKSYFEVAGIIQAMKNGISLESLRRPLLKTSVLVKR